MFDKILNWKLLDGSHEFPGPDGGTCINEAAIVAAGFQYRSIGSCHDCPRCFSRPISAFAIRLNDDMPNELRQELLMPFVTRLAGTRDKPDIELARAKLIVFRTIRDVLPTGLRIAGLHLHAARCASSKNFNAAAGFIMDPLYAVEAIANRSSEQAFRRLVRAVCALIDCNTIRNRAPRINVAVSEAGDAIDEVARVAALHERVCAMRYGVEPARMVAARRVYTTGISILDEAIRLGKQAAPVETATIVARMEKAKQHAMN